MLSKTQANVLKKITTLLEENNIAFQVTGGLAAIAYGAKRPLYDIDIDVYKKDISKVRKLFANCLKKDFYHLQDEHFDMWLLTIIIDEVNIDISQAEKSYFINKKGKKIKMDSDISKAKIITIGQTRIPIQKKKELVAYKKIIGRKTDLLDIQQITN